MEILNKSDCKFLHSCFCGMEIPHYHIHQYVYNDLHETTEYDIQCFAHQTETQCTIKVPRYSFSSCRKSFINL